MTGQSLHEPKNTTIFRVTSCIQNVSTDPYFAQIESEYMFIFRPRKQFPEKYFIIIVFNGLAKKADNSLKLPARERFFPRSPFYGFTARS